MLHINGTGNVLAQASIVNLFIPERMLEPIATVINWKEAVHLGKVNSLDCKSEPNALRKGDQGGGRSCPQNCPISIHHCSIQEEFLLGLFRKLHEINLSFFLEYLNDVLKTLFLILACIEMGTLSSLGNWRCDTASRILLFNCCDLMINLPF